MPPGLDLVLAIRAAEVKACTYATENGEPVTDLQTQLTAAQASLTSMTGERNTAQTAMADALAKLQADKAADATSDAARDAAIVLLGG